MNAYCVNSSGLELEWWDELDQDPSIKAVLEGNLAISSTNKWTYSDPECSFLGFCPRWTFTHVHRKGMGNYSCSIVHNIIIPQTINTANVNRKCKWLSRVLLFMTPCIVHGILQAKILEWVAFPFSRGSSQPRNRTRSPALQADSLPTELSGKPQWLTGKYPNKEGKAIWWKLHKG